jgi:glycosyltransferase involved in cell wall biosynthesis
MASETRPTVLVLCDYFLPGYRAGGVLRTVANMLALLGAEFRFRVVTRGRDYATDEPYPGIETRAWIPRSDSEVQYLSDAQLRPWILRRILNETPHDVLYLNSVVSPWFAIAPAALRRLGLVPRRRFVVAPNGELAESALRIKRTKKVVFLAVARALGLYAAATWRASDEREADDIRREFGDRTRITVAENLPTPPSPGAGADRAPKRPGRLDVVYLARLARIKNLVHVLRALGDVRGEVRLDLYGPKDDPEYWTECEEAIAALPDHVRVEWKGALPADRVPEVLGRYELFVLPSTNESFGYSVAEALCAGCPVLVSDRTPWRGLEGRGVGWDVPLGDPADFTRVFQRCIDMDEAEHARWREAARRYGTELSRPAEVLDHYRTLIGTEGSGTA